MADSKPVEIPSRATPVEPGEPVQQPALSQMGGTFADRAKARKKLEQRAVQGGKAENKQVKPSRTK